MKTELERALLRFHRTWGGGMTPQDVEGIHVPAATWLRWVKLAESETDAPLFDDDAPSAEQVRQRSQRRRGRSEGGSR